jgi:hypothetical protein
MKVLKVVSVLFVMIVSLLSVACTTNVEPIDPAVLNPNIDPNAPVEGTFKVDFEDQTFSTISASALITPNSITIGALKASTGENFTINLTGVTLGEYSTTDQVSILYKEETAGVFGYLSKNTIGSTATVNITSINNATRRIKGTFKFIGNWNDPTNATPPAAIQFTNGTFDVPFTTPDVSVNTASFKVDIDGVPFEATSVTAVKSYSFDPITNEPVLDPNTNQQIFSYSIIGTYNQTSLVSLSIFESTEISSHDMPGNGAQIQYMPNQLDPMTTFSSHDNVGNITISSNDAVNKIMSGTFYCKVHIYDMLTGNISSSKQLTNGVFTNVTYTIE